ncbi:TPA: hypothetical protein ACMDWL_004559, partial [Vibrio parahaemolyticus]
LEVISVNEENKLYTSMISIVTSIGAFSVSGISIYCGYDLFRLGVETKVALTATTSSESLELYAITPGIAFLFFGIYISRKALKTLIGGKGLVDYIFEFLNKNKQ